MMSGKPLFALAFAVVCTLSAPVHSGTFHLKDGTLLKGTVLSQTNGIVRLSHPVLGILSIPQKDLRRSTRPGKKKKMETRKHGTLFTKMKFTGSMSMSHGTSSLLGGAAGFCWNRNRLWIDEWTFTVNGRISREEDRITDRVGAVILRYGRSFSKRLYGFVRTAFDHDNNSGIEYRLQPTSGAGFWFSDQKRLQTFIETGAGAQYISRIDEGRNWNWVLQFRFSLIWKPLKKLEIRTDNLLFPPNGDFSELRYESANVVALKIIKKFALTLNYTFVLDNAVSADTERVSGYFAAGIEWIL